MAPSSDSFLHSCIAMMVRPIAEFCISRGVRFQDFIEISKQSFVGAAMRQLESRGKEVSTSRLSVMTGLQRPEIKRLQVSQPKNEPKDLVTRIIGQWERDPRFLDSRRKPRTLSIRGTRSDFAKLIRAVSTDLNPHTVRFELERLGLIELIGDGARLLRSSYCTQGDPEKTIRLGNQDIADLMHSIHENAFSLHQVPNLQARTEYDNIPDAYIPKIREKLLAMGSRFHAECRAFLASYDRDIHPKTLRGEGRNRVVIGAFSRIEEFLRSPSTKEEE